MFRRAPKPIITPAWMIVGLGNPGPEYRGTRHNVGFEVLDRLAERLKIKLDQSKFRARYGLGEFEGVGVLLAKPMTYMNLSGQAIAPLAASFQLAPSHILVVADDLDMVLGRTRLKPGGSAGGHNGHKSLIASLKTTDYPRLKIGIGSVVRGETIDHVLGTFTPGEREAAEIAVDRSVQVIIAVLRGGIDEGMIVANAPAL